MSARFVAPGYEQALHLADELDAQVCAIVGDETVLAVGGDEAYPLFSCTKGILGAVMALLVDRGMMSLDATVGTYWPEFRAFGKDAVTVRQALSHQAAVPAVHGGFTTADLLDHERQAARVAQATPWWPPGEGFSYHALTIGTIAEELVRRIDGRTLAQVYTEELAVEGLELGCPQGALATVAPPTEADMRSLMELLGSTAPLGPKLPPEPVDAESLFAFGQSAEFLASGNPAAGAVGSARGLARFYASLPERLSPAVLTQCIAEQVSGRDRLNGRDVRYGVAFERPSPLFPFGGDLAFGHGGMGGAAAFSDGTLAFGFVPARLPGPQVLEKVRAVVSAVHAGTAASALRRSS